MLIKNYSDFMYTPYFFIGISIILLKQKIRNYEFHKSNPTA